jgi:hypothetical protein
MASGEETTLHDPVSTSILSLAKADLAVLYVFHFARLEILKEAAVDWRNRIDIND